MDGTRARTDESGLNTRRRIRVRGVVQGVGFRPFVFRLTQELNLAGFVGNDSEGVIIEVEGKLSQIESFVTRLKTENPVLSGIVSFDQQTIQAKHDSAFRIITSSHQQVGSTLISPDIATCPDCLAELFDPKDRQYRYPFINCTNCGPRYTIIESIPYDRPRTSMKVFPMCSACASEYKDPVDRRFHAQPNACPVCGPRLSLYDGRKAMTSTDPIQVVVDTLKQGKIVAIRGVGGFHIAVDPFNVEAVNTLRARKGRAEKPFALMADSVATVRKYCHVSDDEARLLQDHARPIVLLRRKRDCAIPQEIAPFNKYIGFMLPYTPLHHLLLKGNFDCLVMTSANYSEEPIAIGNDEAITRLGAMVDLFLLHDREILQRCDDSVARIADGRVQLIRRSRGYVPLPVSVSRRVETVILGCGGELKNTIALSRGNEVFHSQHIGDLDNPQALAFYEHSISHLAELLEVKIDAIAHDMHPEYLSTRWARAQNLPTVAVQHHHAHLASVLAENQSEGKAIGIILDGTGYGTDGTIWGGELLIGDMKWFDRFAWLAPVPMPGGSAAIKQPWRMAVSHLYHAYGKAFTQLDLPVLRQVSSGEMTVLTQMIDKGINSPLTSSCGRLFDAVAAIVGIRDEVTFEAQAAIELEMAAEESTTASKRLEPAVMAGGAIDTSYLIKEAVEGFMRHEGVQDIAAKFHHHLAELLVAAAVAARRTTGIETVALSGGVFQNRFITKYMLDLLRLEKFTVLQHRELPVNDAGLALGQIMVARAQLESR